MRPRIVWFATARSPYNDFLFGELAKHVDLTVFVRIDELPSHPWKLPAPAYDCRSLHGRLLAAIAETWRARLVVVVGWDHPAHLVITAMLPPTAGKVFWTDTPDVRSRGLLHQMLRALVVRFVFWRFENVWATGGAGCKALEILGCPRRKLSSFPFFVDNEGAVRTYDETRATAFRRQHAAIGQAAVICVGRLIPSKRFDDAIRAMGSLGESAVLWIAGDGPEKARLVALARQLGVEDRVRFLGWLQPSDIAVAMDASDIFLHPAEFDPFPTVVLEAMARGKPVVGSSTSGSVADRVVDGWNGYVVPPRDVHTLAVRLRSLVDDRDRLSVFGQRSRETACKFPVESAVEMVMRATR